MATAEVSCAVALTGPAPEGGLLVQLISSSPNLSVPATITVPAGSSGAGFVASALDTGAPDSAIVTATSESAQVDATVALISSTTPVEVIAKSSGKCLDVRGASTSAGALLQQWTCWGGDNQKWLFKQLSDGSYDVVSVHSNLAMTVYGGTGNGVPIDQSPYSGASSQKWKLRSTGTGYYNLVPESSGRCLDVRGGSGATADGALVQQWDCWGGTNQAWQLVSGPSHSTSLNWTASGSSGVTGYYVYRATASTGPYTRMSSALQGTSYVDGAVQAGQTYYYAATAINSSNQESAYSNQVKAVIPTP